MDNEDAQKLAALRGAIVSHSLDGYLIPQTDEYQNEFVPACYQRLRWVSGFTGSAGMAIVLNERAVVMSDGRYTIQLHDEIDAAHFTTADSTKISAGAWLNEHAPKGAKIGYDPRLFTPQQIDKITRDIADNDITLMAITDNLIDAVWQDRPAAPRSKIETFPHDIAGLTAAQKIEKIAAIIAAQNADAVLLTAPESVCWLLNVRGSDTPCTPLILSEVLVRADGHAVWFIDAARAGDDIRAHIGNVVTLAPPLAPDTPIPPLAPASERRPPRVMLDLKRSSAYWHSMLRDNDCTVIDHKDPCIDIRACKTAAEIRTIKDVHVQDGIAVTALLKWVNENNHTGITEMDVGAKIDALRAAHPAYRGESFNCIAGYGSNGAIIHYRATAKTNAVIKGNGLLLIDSGGQYARSDLFGTTDITRTIAIGTPTDEMREMYTRVLKGHIALARAVFPVGTTGKEIDILARAPLREINADYAHGTGHGVGCYLSVHEEAASISWRGETPLAAGMVISNEPGYYKTGAYGIRLENLILVVPHGTCADTGKDMLTFETISLARFDDRLIINDMLSDDEGAWLTTYHDHVDQKLQ